MFENSAMYQESWCAINRSTPNSGSDRAPFPLALLIALHNIPCRYRQAGSLSILFRQTNAVWVSFTLAVCLLEDFLPIVISTTTATAARAGTAQRRNAAAAAAADSYDCEGSDGAHVDTAGAFPFSSLPTPAHPALSTSTDPSPTTTTTARRRKRRMNTTAAITTPNKLARSSAPFTPGANPPIPSHHPPLILLWRLARAAMSDAVRGAPILRARLPLAMPVVAFASFVFVFNGGAIALGDKENHSPGGPPHLAQLGYFAAVCASLWGVVGKEAVSGMDARRGFVGWLAGSRQRGSRNVARMVGSFSVIVFVAFCSWR